MRSVHKAGIAGGAGVIAAAVAFTPIWEGMDKVAKRDAIGTGHPVTYCYGQTAEFGKVAVGTKFTKQECDAKLAQSLPMYLADLEKCIHVDMPDKTKAAYLDASYNAGAGAVCHSPMVAKANAGNLHAGCLAFEGWFVRSDGQIRKGLANRRHAEKLLCLEGIEDDRKLDRKVSSPVPAANPPVRGNSPRRWWWPFGG